MSLISVIVPVYNAGPYLEKCASSLAAQTHKELDVILVNDGSTDDSAALCASIAQNDPRFRVIDRPNGGVSAARNTGIDAARGEWLAFVDCDDWVAPEMLEKMLCAAQKEAADIVECGYYRSDAEGNVLETLRWRAQTERGDGCLESLLNYSNGNDILCDKLYRASLWRGIRLKEGLNYGEDYLANIEVYLGCRVKTTLPDCFYYYFVNEHSATNTVSAQQLRSGDTGKYARALLLRERPELAGYASLYVASYAMNNYRRALDTALPERKALAAELLADFREHYPLSEGRALDSIKGSRRAALMKLFYRAPKLGLAAMRALKR